MQIVTGYYAALKKYQGSPDFNGFVPVAISAKVPSGWRYPKYQKFAPSYAIWKERQDSQSEDRDIRFTQRFSAEILSCLSPETVRRELETFGEKLCLMCYEKSNSFCHRNVVAEWLTKNLHIDVKEFVI